MENIQQVKGIENISELDFISGQEGCLSTIFSRLLKQLNLNSINTLLDQSKCKGADPKSMEIIDLF